VLKFDRQISLADLSIEVSVGACLCWVMTGRFGSVAASQQFITWATAFGQKLTVKSETGSTQPALPARFSL
jgi:hypothetical protein